jgi:signal transduction histidine kinase
LYLTFTSLKVTVISFFACLVSVHLFASQPNPEMAELKREVNVAIQGQKTDTTTINKLNQLAVNYFDSQPDSTAYYATLAISLSNKLNFPRGAADAYIQLGTVNAFKGNFKAAKDNFNQSLKLYTQIHSEIGISESYMGFGRLADYAGEYDKAIKWYQQAISLRKALYEDVDVADSYSALGITYDKKGDYSKALDCFFYALQTNLHYNLRSDIADNYRNIGLVMQQLEMYPKALQYFNKALNLWQALKDKQGISTAYQNIGEVLLAQKKFKNSFPYLTKASAILRDIGDQDGISLIYYDLGQYYYFTNQPDSAKLYLNRSLQSATKNNLKFNQAQAYIGLAQIYNLQGNYKQGLSNAAAAKLIATKLGSTRSRAEAALQISRALAGSKQYRAAFDQHQAYVSLKDSLKSNDNLQKLMSFNVAVEFENKQRDAIVRQQQKELLWQQKLSQQKLTNIIYVVVIAVLAIMLVVYYNARTTQIKANKLLEEKNKQVELQKADLTSQTEQLNESNVLKDRLISVLAHDLRAPISTLRGMFSLMGQGDITREEFIEMAPKVYSKLEHTSDFLDTLLFWINSQVDDVESTVKSFCLCDVVENELNYLEDQFRQKNITPVNSVTSGHVVLADPNCVRIVIHNFLTNAIKFSNKNSVIEISAKMQENKKITFTVTDHGIGMTNQQLNALFKSKVFSSPGTMLESGTGMGLMFCKDLIEKYHGSIWAKSAVGVGTELGFSLTADKSIKS